MYDRVVAYYSEERDCFPLAYLELLRRQIIACPYLAANNLTKDFVGTRGFSLAFRRETVGQVVERFPWSEGYLDALLDTDCNAFYFNPLVLAAESRVDPHVDRSLRAYCKAIETPLMVSVLYVDLPAKMAGGDLVLRAGKREVGRIAPLINKVVRFQGDLVHQVTAVSPETKGSRISLVCEQYALEPDALSRIPDLAVESRRRRY